MIIGPPTSLAPQHRLDKFDCADPTLNDWLSRHARQSQASGSAKTFVVTENDCVAGYFSLTVGQIEAVDAPERIRKGMGQYPVPVVILARLAVSQSYQGQGIGVALLIEAVRRALTIAGHAGIRAILMHPISAQAAHFYAKFGFEPSPLQPGQLLLLLKDARRLYKGLPG